MMSIEVNGHTYASSQEMASPNTIPVSTPETTTYTATPGTFLPETGNDEQLVELGTVGAALVVAGAIGAIVASKRSSRA